MNSQSQLQRTTSSLLVGVALLLVHFSAFAAKDGNTSFGVGALPGNTTGDQNTAMGNDALKSNTTGSRNTAIGFWALLGNTAGNGNVANGAFALNNNASGIGNTAVGTNALVNNTTGGGNIALGIGAGLNLMIGNNDIYIGNRGGSAESKTIRIGTQGTQEATFIAGIFGASVNGVSDTPVIIDNTGKLGTATSSQRFKKDIKPMDQASEAILSLKPVTFHYKTDNTSTARLGLIAEEVAEINPDLVVRDENGEIYAVRYDAVNAMLLNEFLKEHRKNEEQQAAITRLEKQITALTAGLQKVSAQLELSKVAPQTVAENR
jgi:Chaperone of endosialidase